MPAYTVYFGNPCGLQENWGPYVAAFRQYFEPVIAASNVYDSLNVRVANTRPQVLDNELLIYILPRASYSLIRAQGSPFSETVQSATGSFADGATAETNQGHLWCSEVYKAWRNPQQVALLAYHEAMHNKLKLGTALHAYHGLAGETITVETHRRGQNDRRMAEALTRSGPQWLGGYERARRYVPDEDPTSVLGGSGLEGL